MISSRSRQLGREFVWIAFGQGLAASAGLVGVRLLTNRLSPVAYGELALGMTVATVTGQVILSPLCAAFLRFFSPAQERNQLTTYLYGVRVLLAQATAVQLVFAVMAFVGLWAFGHTEWLALMGGALTLSLLSGYRSAIEAMQIAARQRTLVAWHQGLGEWLRFLAAAALISSFGAFSRVAMLGYALATSVTVGSQLLFFRRKTLPLKSPGPAPLRSDAATWIGLMRSYAWPFSTWGLFTFLQFTSDRWALQTFTTTSNVGLYAVLYQLGYYSMMIVSAATLQLTIPLLFSRAGDGSDPVRMTEARRLTRHVVLGSLIVTLLGALLAARFHDWVFRLFVGPDYGGVSSLLPWMVLAGGLFGCGQAASQSVLAGVDARSLIAPKIVTAVFGTLLNFAGAYLLGLTGVVFASTLSALLYFAWTLHLCRELRNRQPGRSMEKMR